MLSVTVSHVWTLLTVINIQMLYFYIYTRMIAFAGCMYEAILPLIFIDICENGHFESRFRDRTVVSIAYQNLSSN